MSELVPFAHDNTQGYGSFTFFRPPGSRSRPRRKLIRFPFMKLPREVRNYIYDILISPMPFYYANYLPQGWGLGLGFIIKETDWEEGGEIDYNYTIRRWYDEDGPQSNAEYYLEGYKAEDLSNGEVEQTLSSIDQTLPDVLSLAYQVQLTPDSNPQHAHRRRVMQDLKFIRGLSQLNHQFSKEMMERLWRNSVLEIEDLDFLPSFVKVYQATLPHIKGLVLHLCFEDDFLDTSTSNLEKAFNLISRHMRLSFIFISLKTTPCLEDQLLERLEAWTAIFRKSRPSEKFDVHPRIATNGTFPCKKVNGKRAQKMLMDAWMPDCLRGKSSKDLYIEERKE